MDHIATAVQVMHRMGQSTTESNRLRCSETLPVGLAHLSHPPAKILRFNPRLDDRDVVTQPMVFENLRQFGILLTESLQHTHSLPSLIASGQ